MHAKGKGSIAAGRVRRRTLLQGDLLWDSVGYECMRRARVSVAFECTQSARVASGRVRRNYFGFGRGCRRCEEGSAPNSPPARFSFGFGGL